MIISFLMQIRDSWDDLNFRILCWMGHWSLEMPREPLHQIWMRSNQRAHKLFGSQFFAKCSPSAILFFINYSEKLIRTLEIPGEPLHKIWMWSGKQLIRYRAHKLFAWESTILLYIVYTYNIALFRLTMSHQFQVSNRSLTPFENWRDAIYEWSIANQLP